MTDKPKDGGPVHPMIRYQEGPNKAGMQAVVYETEGMSVRLHIATEMLKGILANGHYMWPLDGGISIDQMFVNKAFEYADLMIAKEGADK